MRIINVVFGRAMAAAFDHFLADFPPVVNIETTNHCNASCSFCPRDTIGRDMAFMDNALFEKIVDECAARKPSIIHLHGFGEPLLDKRLAERISGMKRRGIGHISIFTNGALLRGAVAERLLQSGIDEIKLSVDGADSNEFRRVRIGLELGEVLDNLRRFKMMRSKQGVDRPTVTATCSVTSNTRKTRRLLEDAVDRVVFSDLHNWAGGMPFPHSTFLRQPCHRLWRTLTILVDGDVALCCLDHSGTTVLGNCRDQDIGEIWTGARYRESRRMHRYSRQSEMALCSRCTMSFVQPGQLVAKLSPYSRRPSARD